MRLVYGFQDKDIVSEEGSWMVAKFSRFLDATLSARHVVEAYAKSTAVARYFAVHFNECLRKASTARLIFVPCFVYEVEGTCPLPSGEGKVFTAERYLPGAFVKYNSNNGYVSEAILNHHESVQAFLHYTFIASGEKLLVADLQGVSRES